MALHSSEVKDLERLVNTPVYARPGVTRGIPRDALPPDGMDPKVASSLISDELLLDGNARQNLATFVTTFMEPEAAALFARIGPFQLLSDGSELPVFFIQAETGGGPLHRLGRVSETARTGLAVSRLLAARPSHGPLRVARGGAQQLPHDPGPTESIRH